MDLLGRRIGGDRAADRNKLLCVGFKELKVTVRGFIACLVGPGNL